jgi:hypothetical protein
MALKKSLSPQKKYKATKLIMAYIKDLRGTGLFGNSDAEVAGRMVAMSIERLIQEKTIVRRQPELEPESDDDDEEEGEGKKT